MEEIIILLNGIISLIRYIITDWFKGLSVLIKDNPTFAVTYSIALTVGLITPIVSYINGRNNIKSEEKKHKNSLYLQEKLHKESLELEREKYQNNIKLEKHKLFFEKKGLVYGEIINNLNNFSLILNSLSAMIDTYNKKYNIKITIIDNTMLNLTLESFKEINIKKSTIQELENQCKEEIEKWNSIEKLLEQYHIRWLSDTISKNTLNIKKHTIFSSGKMKRLLININNLFVEKIAEIRKQFKKEINRGKKIQLNKNIIYDTESKIKEIEIQMKRELQDWDNLL